MEHKDHIEHKCHSDVSEFPEPAYQIYPFPMTLFTIQLPQGPKSLLSWQVRFAWNRLASSTKNDRNGTDGKRRGDTSDGSLHSHSICLRLITIVSSHFCTPSSKLRWSKNKCRYFPSAFNSFQRSKIILSTSYLFSRSQYSYKHNKSMGARKKKRDNLRWEGTFPCISHLLECEMERKRDRLHHYPLRIMVIWT